jgi:hypothetical protein
MGTRRLAGRQVRHPGTGLVIPGIMIAVMAVILVAVSGILLAMIIGLFRQEPAPDPGQQAFLRWETCTLNDQPRCGPMPQP